MAQPDDLGPEGLLDYLESGASSLLRISDRQACEAGQSGVTPELSLNQLYRRYVQSNVVPFRTHLPMYTLRAAAGKFLENDEISEDGWVEMPHNVRLTNDMFLGRIVGHSMEPAIPDGALCVFKLGVAGSRANRLVLVEDRQTSGDQRYSIKRYRSNRDRAEASEEGTWRHSRIRLESLNPAIPPGTSIPKRANMPSSPNSYRSIE